MSNTDGVILLSGLEASMERLAPTIVAQIKRITGENKIRVETKYKNGQDVTIRFKLLLATNGAILLQRNASDDAFYRRTIIIPFRRSTEPGCIIADMPKRLWDERNAILSKAARSAGEVEAKKLRRDSMEHVGEVRLYPCLTRLKWKETVE